MTDAARKKSPHSREGGSTASTSAPSAAVFVVSFLAAFAAAGSAFGLGGFLGLGVGVGIGLVGAGVCAALAVQGTAGSTAKATALLDVALSDEAPSNPPAGFRAEPWASLYREVTSSAESKRTASMALLEIERLRRSTEGSSPLESHVPGPTHGSEELVGHEEEIAARDVGQEIADALRPYGEGLAAIEADLASVLAALRPAVSNGTNLTNGTPAAMVDTLVRTAADGIEDLAAGLMRANELAGVAERVTNRATLLALNAALEATRSGSESFASIAEETRRLAEYAREATDTISRLSSEIEFKVGETIAAIQSTSEDAKAAVASMGNGAASATGIAVAPATVETVEALLARARALRERMSAPVASPEATPQGPTGGYASDDAGVDAAATDEAVPAWEPSARVPFEGQPSSADAGDVADTVDGVDGGAVAPLDAGFELSPRYEPGPGGAADRAFGQTDDEPRPIVVTIDAADEESSTKEGPTATPAGEPEPEREREARNAPVIEPKIPDWLEGIRPGENQ